MIRLYTLICSLLLPGYILFTFIRQRRHPSCRFPQGLKHRLGLVSDLRPTSFWIHAVSAGEVQSAATLIYHFEQRFPQTSVTLSCGSINGIVHAQILQKQLASKGYLVQLAMLPADLPWILKRFINKIKPKVLLVVENDIWPNLFRVAQRLNLPSFTISYNISPKTFARQMRFAKQLMRKTFSRADHLFVQTDETKQYLQKLGVEAERISVNGNLKFSITERLESQSNAIFAAARNAKAFVWTAGSTYKGEEEMLWLAHQQLIKSEPNAILFYAPRQASHFKDSLKRLQKFCQQNTLSYCCLSDKNPDLKSHICLIDVSGILREAYKVADIAFVGGSLVNQGGHNLLEPASLGVASLSGHYFQDQQVIYQVMLKEHAVLICKSQSELNHSLLKLAQDSRFRNQQANQIKQVFMQHQVDLAPLTNRIVEIFKES